MKTRLIAALSFAPFLAFADAPPPGSPNYSVAVAAPAAKVGAAAKASITLKPATGFHVNKEYPTSLKVVAPDGVELPKAAFNKADGKVSETEASFEVPFTAKAAGPKTFTGTLRFAVCTASTCDPKSVPVKFTVEVK